MCEAAIVACNVAEVLGMAMGLHLLFGLSLFAGACVTVADVMLVLRLRARGRGSVETLVAVLVATIALCFVAQLAWARPSAGALWHGLAGVRGLASDPQRLYLAVGIVGATVMPHNLYLHSALVRARGQPGSRPALRRAITAATRDSTASLGLALFVNAAILVVAATAFAHAGHAVVATLPDAYRLLSPLLGVGVASTVFGLGLLASGLSSSITGTLAGQVVMEGFTGTRSTAGGLRRGSTSCHDYLPCRESDAHVGRGGASARPVASPSRSTYGTGDGWGGGGAPGSYLSPG